MNKIYTQIACLKAHTCLSQYVACYIYLWVIRRNLGLGELQLGLFIIVNIINIYRMNTRCGIQYMFVHVFPYSRSNYCLLVQFHESWCTKYTNHMALKSRNYFLKKLKFIWAKKGSKGPKLRGHFKRKNPSYILHYPIQTLLSSTSCGFFSFLGWKLSYEKNLRAHKIVWAWLLASISSILD